MVLLSRFHRILALVVSIGFSAGASAGESAQVFLSNGDDQQYLIGELSTQSAEQGTQFSFSLHKETFGDYFLSMRPFRCLEDSGRMMCYLPYPYDKPKVFNEGEKRPLEYDFLFIQRKASEYGIDPWNGVYYLLTKQDGQWRGTAHAVDLNVLAVPPEEGEQFPLSEDDLHPLEPAQVWLPTLKIEGLKP